MEKRNREPVAMPNGTVAVAALFAGCVDVIMALGVLLVETGAVPREALVAAVGEFVRLQREEDGDARPGRRLAAEVLLQQFAVPPSTRPDLTVIDEKKD